MQKKLRRPASWPDAGGAIRQRGSRLIAAVLGTALLSAGLAGLSDPAHAAAASSAPIVGIARSASGTGYWEVATDGGIFAFGDAMFYGSMGGKPLNKPVVGIAAAPDGRGYWEVASDGGIFAFGSAQFYGSMGGKPLNAPVVGIAATPDGRGYWEVASDGGVFAFGSAPFKGSQGGRPLNSPVTAIAATTSGQGYWEVAADGGVFAFGDAGFYGSLGSVRLAASIVSLAPTPRGDGYWMSAVDGGVFAFGAARYIDRAVYTPPSPPASTAGQRAANLAIAWKGYTYTGVNNDMWGAGRVEYWCADFQTYVWQHAGISIPHYAAVADVRAWGQRNGRWSTDVANARIGDAVIYGTQHVGVIVQILSNGSVVSADGDFSGTSGQGEVVFAKSAKVLLNTWQPSTGRGAGGYLISGYVRAG